MAKFCTKCGKPLVDGKPCSCQEEATKDIEKDEEIEEIEEVEEVENTENDTVTSSNELVNDVKSLYVGMIKKPATTIENYSKEKNVKLALVLLIITAFVSGIMTYSLTTNGINGIRTTIANKLTALVANTTNGISSILGGSANITQSDINSLLNGLGVGEITELLNIPKINVPFFDVFLPTAILVFAVFIVVTLFARLFVGKVFKGKGEFDEYLTVVGVASVFQCVAMVAITLISYVSYKLAFILLPLSFGLFIASLIHGLKALADKNKLDKGLAIAMILAGIVLVVGFIVVLSVIVAAKMA